MYKNNQLNKRLSMLLSVIAFFIGCILPDAKIRDIVILMSGSILLLIAALAFEIIDLITNTAKP
jgi:hypothetical protein